MTALWRGSLPGTRSSTRLRTNCRRSVLMPEGLLLLAFQAGNERVRLEQAYGHSVSYDAYRLDPDMVAGMLVEANFEVDVRVHRAPMGYESTSQAFLLARERTS